MKCPFHKDAWRPDVCHDCARLSVAERPRGLLPILRLTDDDRARIVRRLDLRTRRIYFSPVGPLRIAEHVPWGQTWD